MSLWPPGVVQRLSNQAPPQHVVQHPRAPIVGWSSAQQQHPAQLQQLCLLLQHEQQQQQQQQQHWEHSVHYPPEGYIYRDASHQHQQQLYTSSRGLATVAVAAAAAAAAAVAGARAAADITACWPASAFNNISNVVDMQHELVQWPQDKQPKLGHITKNKLRKLTAVELRAELSRLQLPEVKGLKEDYINALLAHLLHPTTAAAAAAGGGGGGVSADPVQLTVQGVQLLQLLAPAVSAAAQQQLGPQEAASGLGLRALARCQVEDLRAALMGVWPFVSPAITLSQEQLLAGSAADLVHKLLLCLAACADTDQHSIQQGLKLLQAQPPPPQQQQQQPKIAHGAAAPAQATTSEQQKADPVVSSSSSANSQQQAEPSGEKLTAQQYKQSIKEQLEASLLLPGQQQQVQHIRPAAAAPQKLQPQQQQQQQQQQQHQPPPPKQQQQSGQQGVGAKAAKTDVPPGYTLPHGPVIVPGTMPPWDAEEAARVAAAVGVSLDELPPLAQQARGHVYPVDWMTSFTEVERDLILRANRAGLTFTLVGGAADGAASGDSSSCCLALLRERDAWLFDVGEDTQRLLMWQEHLRPSKMHRVVVSRQSPDALLGLPGVLCIIGASREKGHEKADIPVHVFAPEGTCEFLSTMYDCGNTYLEMPVMVHEFVHHAVSKEDMEPQLFNPRSKLWRVLLPPDQLNPDGYVDANLDNFNPLEGRARLKTGSRSSGGVLAKNPRAGYRPLPTPPPGDPSREGLPRSAMTWTIHADEAASLTAVAVEADDLAWAMVWREADKQGNLSVPRCQALNIMNSELYGVAKTGEPVPNDDGILIPAYMVCTQDKPGRKMVLLPECTSAASLGPHAAHADVMFAAAGAARDAAPAAPLGAAVGRCAREWGVRALVTTGMPQSEESMRSYNMENNGFNPAWRMRRARSVLSSSSPSSSRADSEDDEEVTSISQQGEQGAGDQQQQQQPWEQVMSPGDPELAAFLQAVAQEYDCGLLVPGRDSMSLVVEDNSGNAPPPPLDMKAKEEEARSTSLVMCADALLAVHAHPPKRQEGGSHQRQQGGGRGGRGGGRGRGGQGRGGYQQRQGGQQWNEWKERSLAR